MNNSTCTSLLDENDAFLWGLIFSILIIAVFFFNMQRKKILPQCCNRRPGIGYPYNATEAREHRLAAVAIALIATQFILKYMFGNFITNAITSKGVQLMINILIIGVLYYPLNAAFTVGKIWSYLLGSLYIWAYAVVTFLQMWPFCDQYLTDTRLPFKIYLLGELPSYLCLLYLLVKLPFHLGKSLYNLKNGIVSQKRELPELEYVKNLLYPGQMLNLRRYSFVHEWFTKNIYKPVPGFTYSFRILCSMAVGINLIYVINIQIFYYIFLLLPMCHGMSQKWAYQCFILFACIISAVVLSNIILIFLCFHLLYCYRQNLLDMYRGHYRNLTIFKRFTNSSIVNGCIWFPGYQTANMFWGYFLQVSIFIIVLNIPMQIFVISMEFDYFYEILNIIIDILPILIITIFVKILHIVCSKYCFTVNNGKILALNNRRLLFNFMYFMFFYNIINGFFSSVFRFFRTVIYGIWFFPRLDTSLLSHRFEDMDPGFCSYLQFLIIENLQTNPVMISFLHLIRQIKESYSYEYACELKSNPSNRNKYVYYNKWWLLVTLHNNPSLQLLRTHNLQYLKLLQTKLKDQFVVLNWNLNNSMENQNHTIEENQLQVNAAIKFLPQRSPFFCHQLQFCWEDIQERNKLRIESDNLENLMWTEDENQCI